MERIAQLAEADEFRTLTVIDLLRQDIKRSGASSVPLPYLFDALKMKLGGASAKLRKPTEEVVLAIIQLLVECIHAAGLPTSSATQASGGGSSAVGSASGAEAAARGAIAVFGEIMPFMSRDRVRRACGVLLSGALKRGGPRAGAEAARIIGGPSGTGNKDDVSCVCVCASAVATVEAVCSVFHLPTYRFRSSGSHRLIRVFLYLTLSIVCHCVNAGDEPPCRPCADQ